MLHPTFRRPLAAIVALLAAALALTALTACGSERTRDVADSTGLFHFKVPDDWQYMIDVTMTTVYAAEELPEEGEDLDALSIVALVSTTATTTPVPDSLTGFVSASRDGRGWTDATLGEPEEVTIGGRPAYRIDIEAADANGRAFRAAYYWVRTSGSDVLVMAVTPADRWSDYEDDLADVLTNWFWHRPADAAVEETVTP
jgi:hypothetical protein